MPEQIAVADVKVMKTEDGRPPILWNLSPCKWCPT